MFKFLLISLLILTKFLISDEILESDTTVSYYLKNKSNISTYKINFIIFENINPLKEDLQELLPTLENRTYKGEYIKLKEEPTLLVAKTINFYEDINEITSKIQIEQPVVEQPKKTKEEDVNKGFLYFERIKLDSGIDKIVEKLSKNKKYRLLYENSWYQPLFKSELSLPIFIDILNKEQKIHGSIKIYENRYLHTELNLRYAERADSQTSTKIKFEDNLRLIDFNEQIKEPLNSKQKKSNEYWIKTIFDNISIPIPSIDFIFSSSKLFNIYEEKPPDIDVTQYKDIYELKEDRKIEENKFNFFDHPHVGVIMKITKIEV